MTYYYPLPGLFGRLGWPEIILILAVFLLLFGAKRLPEIARAIGKSMKEFKKATKDVKKELSVDDLDDDIPPYPPQEDNQNGQSKEPPADKSSENDESKQ